MYIKLAIFKVQWNTLVARDDSCSVDEFNENDF